MQLDTTLLIEIPDDFRHKCFQTFYIVSSSSANFNKLFAFSYFFTRITKHKQKLNFIVRKIFNQDEIYSMDKFQVFSLNLTKKRLIVMAKVKNLSNAGVKVQIFNTSKIR